MTRRHRFPVRLALLLAFLLSGAAPAAPPVPDVDERVSQVEEQVPDVEEQASEVEEQVPDFEKQALARIMEARGSARAKRYIEALIQLTEAVSLAEQAEDRLPLALALHNMAEVRRLRGETLEALKAYHRVLEVYTRMGHAAGVELAQRQIRELSTVFRLREERTRPADPARPKAPLSPMEQAVERIRQQARARGREDVPAASIEVSSPGPLPAEDNPRQWAYLESLRRKIRGNSRYPDFARRSRQQGTAALVFTVREDGEVESLDLSKSSGSTVLDVEALRNVRESAPFGPLPGQAVTGPLTVRLTFDYRLSAARDVSP